MLLWRPFRHRDSVTGRAPAPHGYACDSCGSDSLSTVVSTTSGVVKFQHAGCAKRHTGIQGAGGHPPRRGQGKIMWRWVVAVVLVVACGTVAGCSSARVGFGIPQQPSPSAFPGVRHDVTGVVVVQENGCVDVDLGSDGRRWGVWPDTVTEANGGADVMVGGHLVADGDQLTGTGMLLDGSELRTWSGRNEIPLGSFGSFCSAGTYGVVILDDATVTTPSAASRSFF